MVRSLCKTVRHQHIEHVGIGESHTFVAAHLALFQLIQHLLSFTPSLLPSFKNKRHRARLGLAHVHIY